MLLLNGGKKINIRYFEINENEPEETNKDDGINNFLTYFIYIGILVIIVIIIIVVVIIIMKNKKETRNLDDITRMDLIQEMNINSEWKII